MKIWLHWPEKHHIIQHGTACAAAPMTHGTLSLIAFTSASFFYFIFCEKWIYICCFLTCRENSIMPPFIIAAFRSSGLFEVLSGIKLMEHLTFLLCRHTLLSLLHRYILTHVASHDMLFGKRCARLSEQLATSQQKPIWANEILQDVSWGLWMRSIRLFNLHSSHLHD